MLKRIVTIGAIIAITAGCSTVARNETSPSPQNNNGVRAQQTHPQKKEIKNSGEVALHLEQLAKGVKGVENAHCVVFGNTAVVGIDVDSKLDRSRVGTIKYSVAEAFHKDPYGIDAIVSADIDVYQRLNEIGADIRRGKPITGFAEEMADIIGRIVPQLPREVMPQEPEKQEAPQLNKRL
ncbi:YhcN/YlaJ family sporulation lipoprotein [Paenibacillus sp. NEAU-GSW1]|uniref:YhcN/YlaJ family sporulation lipoprotein n=1 Tax=Paenibacillus sp. NEAU-GSW1 TaxID=2682486 RepID=UPI0012E19841|nr:YhcN/YlaJ family sporulation lipoprotein [Paenibacillus sp. NEAU-GSW1]MUT66214.1 YhcN/YlaJ family sporulation lipoprotein [Paenibacillus sp. NEAU-GSW1]